MSKNYNPKDFFRTAPSDLLQQLFTQYKAMTDIDFSEKNQTKLLENIFKAWESLDLQITSQLEFDFIEIHSMTNDRGLNALIDELRYHGHDLIKILEENEIEGVNARVFWIYLNRANLCAQEFWNNAKLFQKSDSISKGRWKKRSKIGNITAKDSENICKQFASELSIFLKDKLGKGKNCEIDVLKRQRNDKNFIYFFAYPEDFAFTSLEYGTHNDNSLKREYRRPAFEIIFLYCQEEESLDIWYDGVGKPITYDLQHIFCKNILDIEIKKEQKEQHEYDLNQLKNKEMIFKIDPKLGISSLAVCSLKLEIGRNAYITIDVDASENKLAIYPILARVEGKLDKVFLKVIRAGFIATFKELDPNGNPLTNTFSISIPNNCKLTHLGRDGAIRQVLLDSGVQIDPIAKQTE